MANQRHPDQTLVAFALDKGLLAKTDTARRALHWSRSQFVREAVREKLIAMGVDAPAAMADAPDSTGKPKSHGKITSYAEEDRKRKMKP